MDRATDMPPLLTDEWSSNAVELIDDFADACGEGGVIGRKCVSGHVRLGRDVEGVLSIDNGALRIAPLVQAGFGRAVLSYGPFVMRPGLAFAVFMLNGHNTSQDEPLSDPFFHRLRAWLRASETESTWMRLAWWLKQARFRRALRQIRWWRRTARAGKDMPRLNENLAIGWHSNEVETDPRLEGSGFVMHALGPENGELWAGAAGQRTRALRGVQNLPIYYVAVARPGGTVYYVSSLDGAVGLPSYPAMRPIAVDDCALPDSLYLGIQQAVLGQVGFWVDSRAYGVRVGQLDCYQVWCGGAHAAALLESDGLAHGSPAEAGMLWDMRGSVDRGEGAHGVPVQEGADIALLDPGAPSGLVFAYAKACDETSRRHGLVFRAMDAANHWRLELRRDAATLVVLTAGEREVVASRELAEPIGGGLRRLQILDDGRRLMAHVDGEPVGTAWVEDRRFADSSKVGLFADGARFGSARFRRFEAHPRQIPIPRQLDMGGPWVRKGTQVVVADDFGGYGGDLDGRTSSTGRAQWRRIMGQGRIELTGARSARVQATRDRPCPGRTAYCVDWAHPDFADIEVTITPAGTCVGEKDRTTSGLVLYQDPGNFVIVNAWRSDYYPGGSVSTFFRFGAFEDVYDAVWSNVADRISYGKPLRLRLCSDAERYVALINDEPVLYRAYRDIYPELPPLRIRKVGIIANWEFGNDTGSQFEHFVSQV